MLKWKIEKLFVFSVNVMVSLFVVTSMTVVVVEKKIVRRVTFEVVRSFFSPLLFSISLHSSLSNESQPPRILTFERANTIRFIGSIILFILQILRQNQHLFTTNSIKSLAPTHLSLSRKQFTPFSSVSLALLFLSLSSVLL